MPYKYEISDCDVRAENGSALQRFRAKREAWINWLESMDPPGIWSQIHTLVWNEMVFWTVNEACGMSAEARNGTPAFNPMVREFINTGYACKQYIFIRRIVDKTKTSISLLKLLNDIMKYNSIITREIFISYDGLPYDYEPVMKKHLASIPEDGQPHYRRLPTSGPDAWSWSRRSHEAFDKLSGKTESQRSRDDVIDKRLLLRLRDRLEQTCERAIAVCNSGIAHVADPARQSKARFDSRSALTFAEIEECIRTAAQTAHIVSAHILWDSHHGIVPTPQYDHLKYLDQPLLRKSALKKLYDFWDTYAEKCERWIEIDWPK